MTIRLLYATSFTYYTTNNTYYLSCQTMSQHGISIRTSLLNYVREISIGLNLAQGVKQTIRDVAQIVFTHQDSIIMI